ncbi:tubulin-specific chaperone-like protein c [Macroventuria anomochaeta]|uniref:Tubulin-specific chaperone-like protein c n=1 Tax=Macroventuria anomochaeta TaxID=301207 RepID=A0ACB6S9A2_9PLEO|nr:tubulin-specific chaperone-like protein c [Macroventuria anomochaeta]KAF2630102.1 tubulin-specific chaperone-like protein c [Macroventuria anomochaeta]
MQAASQTQTEVDSKDRFFQYFRHEVTALQEQMERLNSIATGGGERNDAVDHCLAGIDRLSHEVKDASSYIPAYDQRTYSEAIKALSEKLQNIRQNFNPPKKFAFKTRKNAPAISISDAAELAASQRLRAPIITSDTSNADPSFAPTPLDRLSPGKRKEQEAALSLQNGTAIVSDGIDDTNGGVRRPSFSAATSININNHNAIDIIAPASASHATSSGTVTNLISCVVDLSAPTSVSPFSALYLKNIISSTIVTGSVAGATHITDIANTKLYVTTRQFRMHGAKNVDVYLHCASRPIIEDCEGVRFAPLPEELVTDEVRKVENRWDQIDDFKWLKAEQSPNWSILPEGERTAPAKET